VDKNATAIIPVENERIYIAPLINQTSIEKMEDWPQEQHQQRALLKNFTSIQNQLKSEFRRCEKFGFYTVVEDDQNPTIRVSITLDKLQQTEDSLHIPLNMQVEHIPDAKFLIFTIPTSSSIPENISAKKVSGSKLGLILTEYRRKFPYALIVSFFHTQHPAKK
jgi:hypothetical protein